MKLSLIDTIFTDVSEEFTASIIRVMELFLMFNMFEKAFKNAEKPVHFKIEVTKL
jgi:hypothetical protein